jgi:hypothetical protein
LQVLQNLDVSANITNGNSLIMQASASPGLSTPQGIAFAHFYLSDAGFPSILAFGDGFFYVDKTVTGDGQGTIVGKLSDTNVVITACSNQFSILSSQTTNWNANFTTNHEYDITTPAVNIDLTNLQGLSTGFNYGSFRVLNTSATTCYFYFAYGGNLASANAPILAGGLTNGWPITNSIGWYIFNWQCYGTNYLTNATITCANPGQ